jgi:hypothetical protein
MLGNTVAGDSALAPPPDGSPATLDLYPPAPPPPDPPVYPPPDPPPATITNSTVGGAVAGKSKVNPPVRTIPVFNIILFLKYYSVGVGAPQGNGKNTIGGLICSSIR